MAWCDFVVGMFVFMLFFMFCFYGSVLVPLSFSLFLFLMIVTRC